MGLLDGSNLNNPVQNFTKIVMMYCDGTVYQGSLSTPVEVNGSTIYFRGMDNVIETIAYLGKEQGLFEAERVLLTGVSAGGFGTYFWSNYLSAMLKDRFALMSVPDSGIFLANYVSPVTNTPVLFDLIKELFPLILREKGWPVE